MINLIPQSAQKLVQREYWARVSTVWLILLGCTLLVTIVLMLPVYVLVNQQQAAQADTVAVAREFSSERSGIEAKINQANGQARLVVTNQSHMQSYTKYIETINTYARDITLSAYRIETVANSPRISLSGEATTRVALAAFRDALEADEVYDSVILPISALIRDSDLPFTLTVVIATTTPSS